MKKKKPSLHFWLNWNYKVSSKKFLNIIFVRWYTIHTITLYNRVIYVNSVLGSVNDNFYFQLFWMIDFVQPSPLRTDLLDEFGFFHTQSFVSFQWKNVYRILLRKDFYHNYIWRKPQKYLHNFLKIANPYHRFICLEAFKKLFDETT